MNVFRYCKPLVIALIILAAGSDVAVAQDNAIVLSRDADFSDHRREFDEGDVVFVRVEAPDVDPADLEQNELRVTSTTTTNASSVSLRMPLKNNLDGTYTAVLDSLAKGTWYLRVTLADGKGAAFEGDATFVIGDRFETPEYRVEGTITALGDQSLTVLDRRLFVTPNTAIYNGSGEPIEFSSLRIGDRVAAEFMVSFTGELIARSIKRFGDDDHEISLRGRIAEVGDRSFVVLERTIVVDSSTVIVDEYGQHIAFDHLGVGDVVEIKGMELPNGSVLAFRIQREDSHDDEIEFSGRIEEIGERRLVVLGRNLIVNNETEIIGKEGDELDFSDLRVGMYVHVRALVGPTDINEYVATRIKVSEDSRLVVEGSIEELGERELVVAGIPFRVVDDTEIVTSSGLALRFGNLEVGFKVTVFATAINSSDELVALRIVVHRPSVELRTITGFITEIDGDLLVVNGHVIRAVDRTEIIDESGERIRFDDLDVGQRVRVTAVWFLTSTLDLRVLIAERIQVLPDREKRVVGRIRSVSEDHIVISSVEAAITPDTEIFGQNGEPIGADGLAVGQLAAMHVIETVAGIEATRIRLLPRLEDEVGVAGVLESVGDSAVVILGQTFTVLPNTVARDVNGTKIRVGQLEIGKPVALRGEMLAGGTLVALHIQQLANEVKGIKVLGPVESTTSSTIEVIGIHFFVDGGTKIFDLNRNEITLSQIQIGQTVLVGAEGQPNGTRLAKTIQLLDVTVSAGDLRVNGDGTVSILGATYEVAPDALVVDPTSVTNEVAALVDGMYVEVRGSRIDESGYTVTKFKVLSAQSVGIEVEEPGFTLADVALRPNYPNPFSSSTTITFELSEVTAGARTTLTVHDVTGRHVRTLIDANLGSGNYSATWDGRDSAGHPVASGLYFYRVRSADMSVARAMMLVK